MQACWITSDDFRQVKNCHFVARKEFTLDKLPEQQFLRLACENHYLLRINQQIVGRGPARGTRKIVYYDSYDVTVFLHEGKNVIEVLCVHMNGWEASAAPSTSSLWLDMSPLLVSDASWSLALCTQEWPDDGPLFDFQNGFSEWRDLRYEACRKTVKTRVANEHDIISSKTLLPRDIPMPSESPAFVSDFRWASLVPAADLSRKDWAEISTHEPHLAAPEELWSSLYELTTGGEHDVVCPATANDEGITFVADFAKEVSGRFELEVTAPAGMVIDVTYEEELMADGERLRADHTSCNPTYRFCDRYVTRAGRQVIGNVLKERGFRMLQFTFRGLQGQDVIIHRLTATDVRYPFAARATFCCGDSSLNRLWEICRETISACTTDIFTDCPWRERLFYTNDLIVENRVALHLFNDLRLHTHAMDMAFSEANEEGLVPGACPDMNESARLVGMPLTFNIILSSSLTMAMAVWDVYMYSGKIEILKKYYAPLKKILSSFTRWMDADGIINPPEKYWNFFDWSYEITGMMFSGRATSLLNYVFLLAADKLCLMAEEIGEKPLFSTGEIQRIKDGTLKRFWDKERGQLRDGIDCQAPPETLKALGVTLDGIDISDSSRLPHALAILCGGYSTETEQQLQSGLLNPELKSPELYNWSYLLQAMQKLNLQQPLWEAIERYWKPIVDSGSPTTWENGVYFPGKEAFGGTASLCHGFSAYPVALLQEEILGITPLKPGFAEFKFAPRKTDVGFAKGTIPTSFGAIRVSWVKKHGKLEADLLVPEHTRAMVGNQCLTPGKHHVVI